MPKAFSEHEKEMLREQLYQQGRVLFETQGLKKTTVEELTHAVGISKGAFYLFFDSKEDLYLEILEKIEQEIQRNILEFEMKPDQSTHQNVTRLLQDFIHTLDVYTILVNFTLTDYSYLLRKIPMERLQQHMDNDQDFLGELIGKINQQGITVTISPQLLSNLFRGLFYMGLHRNDFEPEAYQEMMDVYVRLIAGYVSGEYNDIRN